MYNTDLKLEEFLRNNRNNKEKHLNPKASYSAHTKGRNAPLQEDFRSPFMRDRDKIIHSGSFRRLKDKAQVFLLPENDMMRTRLTHTLEVSQISRTIAEALGLNETLTEAIALGHDLGHTPFGHIGERAIKEIVARWFKDTGKEFKEIDFLNSGTSWTHIPLKNFKHNIQSLRVVDLLENKGRGLNLTYEVRDGILNHSKWGGGIIATHHQYLPSTLEGQVVRVADRLAYVNHDLEDSIKSKKLHISEVPKVLLEQLGKTHSERIGKAVIGVIEYYYKHERIGLDKELAEGIDTLYSFLGEKIYRSVEMNKEAQKATFIVQELAEFYLDNLDILEEKVNDIDYPKETTHKEKIIDHLCNMTDHFILREFKNQRIPKSWAGL